MEIRIRETKRADAASIAKVQMDTWRTTYAGIVPDEYLNSLSYRNGELWWADVLTTNRPSASLFVAEAKGGEIVGFSGGGPEREGNQTYEGELYTIYILEEYQRRGVGRRLVSAVARSLLTVGARSMLLWVLKDNHPSRRFYEALGGEKVGQKAISIGGSNLLEVAYGWKNIVSLTEQQSVVRS